MIRGWSRVDSRGLLPFIGLIAITTVFTILTRGKLWSTYNLLAVFNQTIPIIMGGLGMIFVVAQGGVDISQGSLLAIAGTVGALLVNKYGAWTLLPGAILTGALFGFVNGTIVTRLRVPSLTTTLAMLIALRALVAFMCQGEAIYAPWEVLSIDSFGIKLPIFILVVVIMAYIFEFTRLGYYSKAIGENEVVTWYTGVPIRTVKIAAFILSGIMAGLVGALSVGRLGGVDPGMGSFFELEVLLALFTGGVPVTGGMTSRIHKLFIGALTVALLGNGLTLYGVSGEVAEGIKGIILILVVFATLNLQIRETAKGTA